MRYLILSDTHGHTRDACLLIEQWHAQIDGVWHLGDHARDLHFLKQQYGHVFQLAFSGVSGNCDPLSSTPNQRIFDCEGRRILMCHGHLHHVKSGLTYLRQKAQDVSANIVLFGHTHIPFYLEENGILYLNPGSLTAPRGGSHAGYALLEISGKKAAASLMDYSNFF